MRAITYANYGSPDELAMSEIQDPTPGPGEVLIEVHAAGLNAADWHLLRADPALARLSSGLRRPRFPAIIGSDAAGVIVAVGERSVDSALTVGDHVYARVDQGACADYVVAKHEHAALAPTGCTLAEAAAVPMAACTALQALQSGRAPLGEGKHVLVNGASGGVGTFAVQIATAMGASVTGVCSGRNIAMVRELGAVHAMDYTNESVTSLRGGFDLILDIAGGYRARDMARLLAPGGTHASIGAAGKTHRGGSGRRLMGPMLPLIGNQIASPLLPGHQKLVTERRSASDLTTIAAMINAGTVRPVIERAYELAHTADAVRHLESERVRGKLIVKVR